MQPPNAWGPALNDGGGDLPNTNSQFDANFFGFEDGTQVPPQNVNADGSSNDGGDLPENADNIRRAATMPPTGLRGGSSFDDFSWNLNYSDSPMGSSKDKDAFGMEDLGNTLPSNKKTPQSKS